MAGGLKSPAQRWIWLRADGFLGEYRIPNDSAAGRPVLEQAGQKYRAAESGAEHCGKERLETGVENAERIIAEELKRRRWQAADLAQRAKRDLGEVKIAGRLREETLVTVKWIAERLQMVTAGYVNNRLHHWRKGAEVKRLSA